MARAWCHRMQHLYNVYVTRGSIDNVAAIADLKAYEAPTEFERLAASDLKRAAKGGISQIQLLFGR